MRTAYDLVWLAAQRGPEQLALVDDRSDRRLTHAELTGEIDAVAAGLSARGIGAGSRVVTALPNLFEHCVVLLALQRLAAVPALLNFRLGAREIATLAQRAEASAAIVLPEPQLVSALRGSLAPSSPLWVVGECAQAEPLGSCRGDVASLPPVPTPDPEDESFLFYTSGTTGMPKAVVLPHRANEPRITWLSTMLGFRSGPHIRALGVSPLSHAIGFHGVFLATLAYGGAFYTQSAFDPAAALDLIEKHRLNYLFSLPTIYAALVSVPSYRPERMASLETVYWGGAAIDPGLLERLVAEWPAAFGHVYGTTETMCALVHPSPAGEHDRLFPAYSSRVLVARSEGESPSGEDPIEAAVGEQGELLIDASGDAVFSEYLGQPEETSAKVRAGWYATGDAAVRLADGSIRLAGRVDDMIRSGGEYIQPEEVERCLLDHPQVSACAVVGLSDPEWGQRAVAAIVAAGAAADVSALDRHCRESELANYKRPRAYLVVDALPTSAGNKLQRGRLREMAEAARAGTGELELLEPARAPRERS